MLRTNDQSTVSFVFYTGMGDQEPMINRVTSWWTGRFMHCEVVFTNSNGTNTACGVWQNETTFFRPKTFGKDCWVWRTIRLPSDKVEKMRRFCARQAQMKIPFNKAGLIRCTTIFPRPTDGTCWFCSELCTAALQEVGLLLHEVPSAMTPSYLYECLGRLDAYNNASPLVEQRIATKKLSYKFKAKPKSGVFMSYASRR